MPGPSFAFRCPECHRLLGASRSRVGSTVKCPKCGTSLIVPDPDEAVEEPPPVASDTRPEPPPSPPIAPEPPPAPPPVAAEPAEPGFLPLVIETEPISLRASEVDRSYRIPDREPGRSRSSASSGSQSTSTAAALQIEPEIPPPDSLALVDRESPYRRGDVVLPRAAFLLWSFVLLLALGMSFTAGLLTGHYVWVESSLPSPAPATSSPPVEQPSSGVSPP